MHITYWSAWYIYLNNLIYIIFKYSIFKMILNCPWSSKILYGYGSFAKSRKQIAQSGLSVLEQHMQAQTSIVNTEIKKKKILLGFWKLFISKISFFGFPIIIIMTKYDLQITQGIKTVTKKFGSPWSLELMYSFSRSLNSNSMSNFPIRAFNPVRIAKFKMLIKNFRK